jgi:hypothetical protein
MLRTTRLGFSTSAALAALVLSIAAVGPVTARSNPDLASHVVFMPTRGAAAQAIGQAKGGGKPGGGGGGTQAGIYYHNGRIASPTGSAFHVVSIYWSNSQIYSNGPTPGNNDLPLSSCADTSLIATFLGGIGGSPYYNINKGYWDKGGAGGTLRNVSGAVAYDGCWADGSSAPSGTQNVSDSAIQAEIVSGFTGGQIAYSPDTLYTVFSAGGVNLGGGAFSQYCAYHGHFTWNGNDVLYAVMPFNAFNTNACAAQATGPNGDAADAEVNTLVHEIEEANTDPDLNAWYDRRGYENADKCAWTFGTTSTASNGAKYNVTIGGKKFLIQRNWKNSGTGSCALS